MQEKGPSMNVKAAIRFLLDQPLKTINNRPPRYA